MIKIRLRPIRSDTDKLTVSWKAPELTVNGAVYDLSDIPDGASITHSVVCGTRTGSDYDISLWAPHGRDASVAERYPEDVIFEDEGVIV